MDLPINSMVIFHSYVNAYQRVLFKVKCFEWFEWFEPPIMSILFQIFETTMTDKQPGLSTSILNQPVGPVGDAGDAGDAGTWSNRSSKMTKWMQHMIKWITKNIKERHWKGSPASVCMWCFKNCKLRQGLEVWNPFELRLQRNYVWPCSFSTPEIVPYN